MTQSDAHRQPREFWIDVGGTFTDCIATGDDGLLRTHKLLSSGVYAGRVAAGSTRRAIIADGFGGFPRGFFTGFRLRPPAPQPLPASGGDVIVAGFDAASGRLELQTPMDHDPPPGSTFELCGDREAPVLGIYFLSGAPPGADIGPIAVRLGTTRGTNALLARTGGRIAFVTTRGLGDLLLIGDQTRPRLFELDIHKPRPLYESVIEIDERIDARGRCLRPMDSEAVRAALDEARRAGIEGLAICLANSYRHAAHERAIGELALERGFAHVSLSCDVSPLQGLLVRAGSTVIDAYLSPVLRDYVERIRQSLPGASIKLMTSAGTLAAPHRFSGTQCILSGPAGGVVGAAESAHAAGLERIISFDMGGTSTDVSRYAGTLERRHVLELEDRESGAALRVSAPALAIETIAAGGGSICGFDGIKPTVGPRSAGADPGPACYGRGGPLCITDANLYLGRLVESNFPFPVSRDVVVAGLDALCDSIRRATGTPYTRESLAAGFIDIANQHMASAIGRISTRRGIDARTHVLVCFGGAGGQHACGVARSLGIKRILVPRLAGVLSAFGIGAAAETMFAERDVAAPLSEGALATLADWFADAESSLRAKLCADGIRPSDIGAPTEWLDLRYEGQETFLAVRRPDGGDWQIAFERSHNELYGFVHDGRRVEIRAARLALGTTRSNVSKAAVAAAEGSRRAGETRNAYFDGSFHQTHVVFRDALAARQTLDGPILILDPIGTTVVEPGWTVEVDERLDLTMRRSAAERRGGAAIVDGPTAKPVSDVGGRPCDPVALELFSHRFGDIAAQMGQTLQRTALSTNVKDRMDFSCALFDREGNLVSHAPHIPVHLGAMTECVRCLIEDTRLEVGLSSRPGDVYLTNDPFRGGSHLPDVTVITPVFDASGAPLPFYTASRAHHAEIGGIAPGSMPPASRCLAEEGVLLRGMRLAAADPGAEGGVPKLRDAELRRILAGGPFPSRAIDQNVCDIQAQAAANYRGARLLAELVDSFGIEEVSAYMHHLRAAAETKMRATLRRLGAGKFSFHDRMDDGAPIAVAVTIDDGRATMDFTGSGPVHPGNLNATPAIVASAALYCMRCIVGEDVPLNSGTLAPIELIIPPGLLNPPADADPRKCPAVAGGNVETSQRIVDVILGALGVAAASQGTMNNLSFGNERFGYYETIGGGSGAGPGFDGASAVHTHMTNTRMTDVEVLEDRYPVRVLQFARRIGSGGQGRWSGGDGIIRRLQFTAPLSGSLLTQRRACAPFGLRGGRCGAGGRNQLIRAGGAAEDLPPIAQLFVEPGDILVIETPGGGGYGAS
jgi:5-oxoprolinase (ATP-hydrolysing)